MEDPTPYRIPLPKMELISRTHTQVTMHRDGLTTHDHRHEFVYEGGTRIHFVNGEFVKSEFDMRSPYSRADWRRLAAIEAEITRLEAAAQPEGLKP
jgi:hypothetical protein